MLTNFVENIQHKNRKKTLGLISGFSLLRIPSRNNHICISDSLEMVLKTDFVLKYENK